MDLMSLENECLRYSNIPIMSAIVETESSFNPFAIGVVGGRLNRQPNNREEAITTALSLNEKGFNFSMGLAQVNQRNLSKYGLSYITVFDPCNNIKIGSLIFNECNDRAIKKFGQNRLATDAALSCYYSGSFTRGQQREGMLPSYVEKVTKNLSKQKMISVTSTKGIKNIKENYQEKPKKDGTASVLHSNASVVKKDKKLVANWDVFHDF